MTEQEINRIFSMIPPVGDSDDPSLMRLWRFVGFLKEELPKQRDFPAHYLPPCVYIEDPKENSRYFEWIWRDDRIYFSFGTDDKNPSEQYDFWGMVINNHETEEYSAYTKKFKEEYFPTLAKISLWFARRIGEKQAGN